MRKKRNLRKVYKQTGRRKSLSADNKRKAKKPGFRKSKTGNIYFESRRNRSDRPGKKN